MKGTVLIRWFNNLVGSRSHGSCPGAICPLSSESAKKKTVAGWGARWGKTNSQFFAKGLLWEEGSLGTGSLMGPAGQPLLGMLVQRAVFWEKQWPHRGIPGAVIPAMAEVLSG